MMKGFSNTILVGVKSLAAFFMSVVKGISLKEVSAVLVLIFTDAFM